MNNAPDKPALGKLEFRGHVSGFLHQFLAQDKHGCALSNIGLLAEGIPVKKHSNQRLQNSLPCRRPSSIH